MAKKQPAAGPTGAARRPHVFKSKPRFLNKKKPPVLSVVPRKPETETEGLVSLRDRVMKSFDRLIPTTHGAAIVQFGENVELALSSIIDVQDALDERLTALETKNGG